MAPDTDTQALNAQLVEQMRAAGVLRSPDIARAFQKVPRHQFLPALDPVRVYADEAIATHHQGDSDEWISSSSQPTMMAIMLEQLSVRPGERILEVGAGTGYNAALLAELAGDADNVWSVDVTPEFCDEARAHLAAAGQGAVHVVCADGWAGWPEAAPYDRITVTAGAHDIAPAWFNQLRDGGTMVLPWGFPHAPQRSLAFRREGGRLVQQSSRLCFFMPLRGEFALTPQAAPQASDFWEKPWAGPSPTGDVNLDDLAFFLSLFLWPLTAIVFCPGEGSEAAPKRLGLLDRSRRITVQIERGARWKILGSGEMSIADRLEECVGLWLRWGRPTPERIHLTAYLQGTAPGDTERLARREWFDYRVTAPGADGGTGTLST